MTEYRCPYHPAVCVRESTAHNRPVCPNCQRPMRPVTPLGIERDRIQTTPAPPEAA